MYRFAAGVAVPRFGLTQRVPLAAAAATPLVRGLPPSRFPPAAAIRMAASGKVRLGARPPGEALGGTAAPVPTLELVATAWPDKEDSVDEVYDVVVVGSGAAGLAAALGAREAGGAAKRILVLEALGKIGGTTAKSGGVAWIPNNPLLRKQEQAAGQTEDRRGTLQLMVHVAHPDRYNPDDPSGHFGITADEFAAFERFYDGATAFANYLERRQVLPHMQALSAREYFAHYPENSRPTGRAILPGLPGWRRTVMLWFFWFIAVFLRGALEGWLGRLIPAVKMLNFAWSPPANFAAAGLGEDLIGQLAAAAKREGVEIRTQQRVTGVLVPHLDGADRVLGVRVDSGAVSRLIGARGGVILATGGFAQNRQLLEASGIVADATCACAGATGTSHQVGQLLGARFAHMDKAWWAQAILEHAWSTETGRRGQWPAEMQGAETIFFVRGGSILMVDANGQRVVNEKGPYDLRSRIHATHPHRRLLILVADRRAVDEVGSLLLATLPQDPDDPAYVRAATLPELAKGLRERVAELRTRPEARGRMPPFELTDDFDANLVATLERFNTFARQGRDLDFKRGESPAEADWDGTTVDVERGVNPTLRALVPPYYAVLVCPTILDTKGGPVTDADGRIVRDADGAPIQGLYAAGNAKASISAGGYWQAGATIGLALVTGFSAGQHAAQMAGRK